MVVLVTVLEGAAGVNERSVVSGDGIHGPVLWKGLVPLTGGTVLDVELEAKGALDWKDISLANELSELRHEETGLFLQGEVEDCGSDGVLILRVGSSIVLIDTVGDPPIGMIGQTVSLTLTQVEMFPTGI